MKKSQFELGREDYARGDARPSIIYPERAAGWDAGAEAAKPKMRAKLRKAFDLGAQCKRGGIHEDRLYQFDLDAEDTQAWRDGHAWQTEQYKRGAR